MEIHRRENILGTTAMMTKRNTHIETMQPTLQIQSRTAITIEEIWIKTFVHLHIQMQSSVSWQVWLIEDILERIWLSKFHFKWKINPREFVSPAVIRRYNFYEWFRNILNNASIDTRFEEQTQHTAVAVRIIRSIWTENVAKVGNEAEVNDSLTSTTERTFKQPGWLHHMNMRPHHT